MTEQKKEKARLIGILTVLLVLKAPPTLILGLYLLTQHWTFLISWDVFYSDMEDAFSLVINTPEVVEGSEMSFYYVLAFAVLVISAIVSLFLGVIFNLRGAVPWILSLIGQIGTLATGIWPCFVYQLSKAF